MLVGNLAVPSENGLWMVVSEWKWINLIIGQTSGKEYITTVSILQGDWSSLLHSQTAPDTRPVGQSLRAADA